MRVVVRVRDAAITVDVGMGQQRLKWLAMVALQRYSQIAADTVGLSHAHVATGLMDGEGNELPPNKSIRVALQDGAEVFALLQQDEDDSATIKAAKGTSRFLMMQGAAPKKCIISGPGITYALAGHSAFFSLQARDTYGNLTSNGGEKFEVKVSAPDSLNTRQVRAHSARARAPANAPARYLAGPPRTRPRVRRASILVARASASLARPPRSRVRLAHLSASLAAGRWRRWSPTLQPSSRIAVMARTSSHIQ